MPDPPSIPTRKLGRNGPEIPAIGFGTMGLSCFYGKVPEDDERLKLLDHAHEIGQRHWDTADGYVDSEDLLGKWFATRPGKRKDIFLATKFAYRADPTNPRGFRIDSSPEYAKEAWEKSSKRLGVDVIDLFYVHRVTPNIPIEHTMKGMAELVAEGKIRYVGLSEVSASTLRRAHAVHPVAAVQVEYSPFSREIESNGVLEVARELGIAIVAYSPLGRGFFAKQFVNPQELSEDDFRRSVPKFQGEALEKNLQLVKKFEAVAEKKNATPGQVTLAWLLAQGEEVIPIPGTRRVKYLEENLAAVNLVLTDEEVRELRDAVDNAEYAGGRYESSLEDLLYADTVALGHSN
ncbi:Aldo/keto reductase [Ascobolus immersus RN42]|uniref:Aldo/keto reductase n=1 Tax=Ascobolus immersus RN42 TaxID=1160509 RepID=A0A3N4IP50_ASCIM|nr:Aldo/keto reductase [Ascobolus immersus RN42]